MNTRDELLSALNSPGWVSGETLSRRMCLTRSAIWKHICKLRAEGYSIESSPKKGYRLSVRDALSPEEVNEKIGSGLFTRKIKILRQTISTNFTARELADSGAPEGTVVIADSQSAGKGRRGRAWFSPAGLGIYFSIILRPQITPAEAAKTTLLMSVCVAETLESVAGLRARIKWPNDILVNGRKIAGILAELSTEMDSVNYLVVGLGVNVNIAANQFPDEIRGSATSVLIETGNQATRIRLLAEIMGKFERYYHHAHNDNFDAVMARWRSMSDIIGRNVTVETAAGKLAGTVIELDRDGALVLKDSKGYVKRILSGDII